MESVLKRLFFDLASKEVRFYSAPCGPAPGGGAAPSGPAAAASRPGEARPRFQLWRAGKMLREVEGCDVPTLVSAVTAEA